MDYHSFLLGFLYLAVLGQHPVFGGQIPAFQADYADGLSSQPFGYPGGIDGDTASPDYDDPLSQSYPAARVGFRQEVHGIDNPPGFLTLHIQLEALPGPGGD